MHFISPVTVKGVTSLNLLHIDSHIHSSVQLSSFPRRLKREHRPPPAARAFTCDVLADVPVYSRI